MDTNANTKAVIRKWYGRLSFPGRFDREIYQALEEISIPAGLTLADCDLNGQDGKWNLLAFLYLCEELEGWYREKGISEQILLDTLLDIVRWTERWSEVKGELFLGELPWLSRHFERKLFKLGRLQFYMAPAHEDIPGQGIRKGDAVMEIHIPAGEKLTMDAVGASLSQARAFFEKYFPEYRYSCFTCHSWLLDDKLKEYLPEGSNILRFGGLFEKVRAEESNALLRFIFRWDTHEENLRHVVCDSDFSARIKEAVLRGETFHEVLGVIPV